MQNWNVYNECTLISCTVHRCGTCVVWCVVFVCAGIIQQLIRSHSVMSFLGGITWKHSDYQNVVIHGIPMKLGHESSDAASLPKDMKYITSPGYGDVLEVFRPFINQEKYGQPDEPVSWDVVGMHFED